MTVSHDPENSGERLLTTNRKALVINLDPSRYGTFAEIGAGQEVVRYFFQAGGASGTVAKTMSAYDMAFSDAIYGPSARYVSRERLETMLGHEYNLLHERLTATRGADSRFFVFADTVAARSFHGANECHGWLGVRFQAEPLGPTNDIHVHVRMWDRENLQQQLALGVFGVNLLYAACKLLSDPETFLQSLIDNLTTERIEVDYLHLAGPAVAHFDNRLLALRLVQTGMTDAVLFDVDGRPVQPSPVLRKKEILVQRGSFHPVTRVNLDLMNCAARQFERDATTKNKDVLPLMEMSTARTDPADDSNRQQLLDRVDTLVALGLHVLVSNFSNYFRLTSYFRRHTPERIGFVMGVRAFGKFLDERAYEHLDGGILEALGRLFKSNVRLYVYPRRDDGSEQELIDARSLNVPENMAHLHAHLLQNGLVEPLEGYDPEVLMITARDALESIRSGTEAWRTIVPTEAAAVIAQRRLFGLQTS